MFRLISFLLLALVTLGCASTSEKTPLCQRCRPQIALVPVKNGTNTPLPWEVECEITDTILDCLMSEGRFWVSPLNQYETALEQTDGRDYFGVDLTFANHFSHNDFLIIVELVDHSVQPYSYEAFPELRVPPAERHFQVLSLGARLRVIDLRHEEPQIVRQEIVESASIMKPRNSRFDNGFASSEPTERAEASPHIRSYRELSAIICDKIEESISWSW